MRRVAGGTVLGLLSAACANLSGLSGGGGDAGQEAATPTVLFGGFTASTDEMDGTPLGDTWSFDGTSWKKLNPPGAPSARDGAGATAFEGAMLLFGGLDASQNWLDDTWEWKGGAWAQLDDGASVAPSPRVFPALAVLGQSAVLFGGYDGTLDQNDTWTWNGSQWTELHPAHAPPIRDCPAIGALNGKIVLFGGETGTTTTTDLGDTWTWDGTDWTEMHPAHSPSARSFTGAATAAGADVLVLFGGADHAHTATLGDTWTWNGTDWTELHPATSPGQRSRPMMSATATGALLFGGGDALGTVAYSDSWLWNGVSWSQVLTTGPVARGVGALVTP